MKKKLLILLVPLVLGGGYVAKAKFMPAKKPPKLKVNGEVYILPKQFTLNLQDGRYATVTAALVLAPGQTDGATADSATATDATVGTLPEEAVIRAIITNDITNQTSNALIDGGARTALEHQILHDITTQTDDKITDVLFTDVAVQ